MFTVLASSEVSSGDVTTIWQTFFICLAACASVIAVCTAVYYTRVFTRQHQVAMKELDIKLKREEADLAEQKNIEYERLLREG